MLVARLVARMCGIFFICLSVTPLSAGTLTVKVLDQTAAGVSDAVVYVLASAQPSGADKAHADVVIDQIDKVFVHPVTVIRPGTSVIFPNHDRIRHHVYSFSPAKTFELPLYKDVTPRPVRFDTPGVVALGCNIHDWMSAYIYIVDSFFTTVTDAGGIAVLTLPDGVNELRVWHPRIKNSEDDQSYKVTVKSGSNTAVEFNIVLKKSFKSIARLASDGLDGGAYR